MQSDELARLAVLLRHQSDACIAEWRKQVRELPSARDLHVPTLNDHMPGLLQELISALESKSELTIPQAYETGSATAHGLQRVQDAFDIEEVVAEYNILRGCIHDLADLNSLTLQGNAFHIINRVFDRAIGVALQAYATDRAREVLRRREEYLAFVAHDLRTPLNAISLAGRVLERSVAERESADADVARMLKALRRNVQHLERLVGKVLEENANLQTEIGVKLERRVTDLWPLVEALIHDLHPVAGTSSTRLVNAVPDELSSMQALTQIRSDKSGGGKWVSSDADPYEKRSQAFASAADLIQQGTRPHADGSEIRTFVVPILLKSDGTLWTVDY